MQRKTYILLSLLLMATLFNFCKTGKNASVNNTQAYLNWNDTVQYVGSLACRGCHLEIYESFMKTGMGKSFDFASPTKSAATYGNHAIVFDSLNNFYYKPYFKNDSMYIKEFRLNAQGDTAYSRTEKVAYIVGSGQHTNSHIYECNRYLNQAPITFYTQDGIWDLAPGFEAGASSRFSRTIGYECMSCHNSYPDFVKTSENKFRSIPLGIGCERCHGPGSEHIRRKQMGEIIDTSKYIDYSIVNPGKLSKDLQMSICQRCHIQGVSVLAEGKDYDDFKPGKPIDETMKVFLPKYDGPQNKFIMASHADRTAMSKCYQLSEMTCISCHNPHVSVTETPKEKFNNACQNCHGNQPQQTICTADKASLNAKNNNCITCHMPMSPSVDIPHVKIHDHFIRKPLTEKEKNEIERFIGLRCVTTQKNVTALDFAKAYLSYYESFTADPTALDSAAYYIKKINNNHKQAELGIHLAFLKDDYNQILKLHPKLDEKRSQNAWTFYRIGEAYYKTGNQVEAERLFLKAVDGKPYNLEFQNKLGSSLAAQNKWEAAKKVFEFIIDEFPKHHIALNNLGYYHFLHGDIAKAQDYYQKSLTLSPDYVPALLNLLGAHAFNRNKAEAKKVLNHLKKIAPNNPKVKMAQQQLLL